MSNNTVICINTMKTIYFVTTNKNKYEDYKKRLNSIGWKLKQFDSELNELQVLDGTEIANIN